LSMATQFAADVLESFAREHVAYEVSMLTETTRLLRDARRGQRPVLSSPMEIAYLESFLVHARLLDEFFGVDKRRVFAADARASDYLDRSWKPVHPVLDTDQRRAVNAQVVHLSVRRTNKVGFDVDAIADAVCESVLGFCAVLTVLRRKWFVAAESAAAAFREERPEQTRVPLTVTTTSETHAAVWLWKKP